MSSHQYTAGHVKPEHPAPPDNPADFNTRIISQTAPYCGDVGGVWMVNGCSGQASAFPNARGMPAEVPGNHFYACCTTTKGMIVGDVVSDLPNGGTAEKLFIDHTDAVVRNDKLFPGGYLARFYPPAMFSWDFTLSGGFSYWEQSSGKPILCRQRGRKLWMLNSAVVQGAPEIEDDFRWDHYQFYIANMVGESVMVGDIYEEDDAAALTTSSSYNFWNVAHDSVGKIFEAIYETTETRTSGHAWSVNIEENNYEYRPHIIGALYGVGNRSLLYVDTSTWSAVNFFEHQTGTPFNGNGIPKAWSERLHAVTEFFPYDGGHHIEGSILMTEMLNPARFPGNINGSGDGIWWKESEGGGGEIYTDEDRATHYPIIPAQVDAPWCVGMTYHHGSLCVGKLQWAIGVGGFPDPDVDTGLPGTQEEFTQDFRIDPRPEEGFAVVHVDDDPTILGYGDPGHEGTTIHQQYRVITITGPGGGRPHQILGGYTPSFSLECRGFDRRVANDCTGAIDCVLWTQGMLIKNDAFLAGAEFEADLEDPFENDNPEGLDDYLVTVRNPVVLFGGGLGDLQSYDDVMEQPTKAGIWIRRWKTDKERLKNPQAPPIFDSETGKVTNHDPDLDYTIEEHNILDDRKTIPDPTGQLPTIPNPDYGWVPVACCLTPFGDFIYTMLQPWSEITWPHTDNNFTNQRRNRFWRIVRPGHWDIRTRLCNPHISVRRSIENDDRWGGTGDYNDQLGSISGSGGLNWHRSKQPVTMSCNEHWLYLRNFAALNYGNFPTEAEPDPVEPIPFASTVLWYNVFEGIDPNNPTFPDNSISRHGIAMQGETVSSEWSIDLATGKIRVPWIGHLGSNPSFSVERDPDTPIDRELLRSRSFLEPFSFTTGSSIKMWNGHELSIISTPTVEYRGKFEQWGDRYKLEFEGTDGRTHDPQGSNASSSFGTVQFVEGYTPPPTDH